ncbi:unnamed protein product [Trichogramma brassicae]|uniref:Uncharacterized protein n=1 Tax=Trichogramma brassicae TaxID=86971 RepID=A0A6H5J9X2_9HYME|nr:unnamed protein product [Trichogramma brassicae]
MGSIEGPMSKAPGSNRTYTSARVFVVPLLAYGAFTTSTSTTPAPLLYVSAITVSIAIADISRCVYETYTRICARYKTMDLISRRQPIVTAQT